MTRSDSVDLGGCGGNRPVRCEDDSVDFHLGLAQLVLTVPLEGRTTLIGLDRLVELAVPFFQHLDQRLQLRERLLETQCRDVRWNTVIGHKQPPAFAAASLATVPRSGKRARGSAIST